ncbi:unannotated protein [freshwater metagenome]|uniref:Unannotated protein n=1 Tax=freshwater metagenome TaxID=449393 RepID=A0A6J6WAN6_9ZZZZ
MLAHLAALIVKDVAEADHVLVRRLIKDQGADRHQGVKPAARLVDGFGDEVRWIRSLKFLVVAMGCAPLSKRHGAGVVPTVNDFGNSAEGARYAGLGKGDVINKGAVRIQGG